MAALICRARDTIHASILGRDLSMYSSPRKGQIEVKKIKSRLKDFIGVKTGQIEVERFYRGQNRSNRGRKILSGSKQVNLRPKKIIGVKTGQFETKKFIGVKTGQFEIKKIYRGQKGQFEVERVY